MYYDNEVTSINYWLNSNKVNICIYLIYKNNTSLSAVRILNKKGQMTTFIVLNQDNVNSNKFLKRPLRHIKCINYDNTFQIVDKRLHKGVLL